MRINRFPVLPFKAKKRDVFLLLNGFMIVAILFFYFLDRHERAIFKSIATYIKSKFGTEPPKDSIIVRALKVTHDLGTQRRPLFAHQKFNTLVSMIHPATFDLQTNAGACGSHSYALSRLLKEFDIETRIAQLTVKGQYAGHMVVEAKTQDGWVLLDPSYNVYYMKPSGKLASIADVQADWEHYSQQTPAHYDPKYNYEGVRYTNWNKIPVLMPALRKVLTWTIGSEKTETISLRTFFLEKYRVLFKLTLSLYLTILTKLYWKRLARYFSTQLSRLKDRKATWTVE